MGRPGFRRIGKRFEAFSRTIWLDHRGLGASHGDPVDSARGDHFVADLNAVLDAVGCERAVVLGASVFGQNAITFAAAHPERVAALVLVDTFAYYIRDDDCSFGMPAERFETWLAAAEQTWGTEVNLQLLAPSQAADERFCQWWCRSARLGISPRQLTGMTRACFSRDVRPLLPAIRVPTLVVHRAGDRYIRSEAGRYMADHIPGATFAVIPGDDHLPFAGDADALVDEIEEFLTGRHEAPEGDVVLTTILFTDIVQSTEQSTRLGPRAWRKLADDHDALVRVALQRHRGREIKTIGDGFLATFESGSRAVRCATEITRGATALGLAVRSGVHSGEVELRGTDIAGLAVAIAKRICDLAAPGQVLVSETIRELIVGSGIAVAPNGVHTLKGVPDEWRLFAIDG